MKIEDVLGYTIIEDDRKEIKLKLNRQDVLSFLKTVAGFSNHLGGDLILGVKDTDKTVVGYSEEEVDSERNFFNNAINEHLEPKPVYDFEFVPYEINDNRRYLIIVHIKESLTKPVVLNYKGMPAIFFRRNGFTNGATYSEISEMFRSTDTYDYDRVKTNVKFDQANFTKLFEAYKESNGTELTLKKLYAIGFMDEDNYLYNGSLMFSDDYKDEYGFSCIMFNGFTRGDDKIIATQHYSTNVIDSLKLCLEFVKFRMNRTLIKNDNGRDEILAYKSRALLEALVNAVAHRDYSIKNSEISVEIYKDRLEITSPGNFYTGPSLAVTYDLTKYISKRRNELVCNILVLLRLMEASGTGFEKIVNDYQDVDEKHKPYIFSNNGQFTICLPDLTYDEGVILPSARLEYLPPLEESGYDEAILSVCYDNSLKASEIANNIGISNSTYFRHNILNNLVRNDLLLERKIKSVKYYVTNASKVTRK